MNIVIVDCFDTLEHRVDLLHKVLTEEGHKVRCFLSDYRHIEKVKRTDQKQDFRFFHAEPYKKNISVERLRSHIKLSRDIFEFIDKYSDMIDALWVLAPPNCFVRDAGKIKNKHPKIKLIVDLIDLWPESMPIKGLKPVLFPWKQLRDMNLRYANVIVTECDLYRDVLQKQLRGKRVETLYLAREDKGYEPELKLPKDKIALCYLGSINNIIDIDGIVRVVEECSKSKPVVLHIIGDGEKKEELVYRVKSVGTEVIDHGKVYEQEEKKRIFDSCHYGLNMMKDSVCVGLTMKSIDYFEFGLPIINNIHGDTWDIIDKYGCGINLGMDWSKFATRLDTNHNRMLGRCFFEKQLSYSSFKAKVSEII